jgi:hypothetical protein
MDSIASVGGVLDMAPEVSDSDHRLGVALEQDHRNNSIDRVDSPPGKPELSKI